MLFFPPQLWYLASMSSYLNGESIHSVKIGTIRHYTGSICCPPTLTRMMHGSSSSMMNSRPAGPAEWWWWWTRLLAVRSLHMRELAAGGCSMRWDDHGGHWNDWYSRCIIFINHIWTDFYFCFFPLLFFFSSLFVLGWFSVNFIVWSIDVTYVFDRWYMVLVSCNWWFVYVCAVLAVYI